MTEKKERDGAGSAGRADDRTSASGRERRHDHLGPDTPRPAPVTSVRSGEPRTADEAGDVSIQNADIRDDVGNTSTSSGTHPGDQGDDQRRKEQLRRGHRGISRMD